MKKAISILLTIAVIITFIPVSPAQAATPTFEEYILSSLAEMKTEIDVLSYVKANGWTGKQALAAYQSVIFDNPQIFYTDGSVAYSATVYSGGVFASFKFNGIKYTCTKSELASMNKKFDGAAQKALAMVEEKMTAAEKALVLHDYLIVNTAYDSSLKKYNAYNCLVEGSAVCQGYALAYKYLMNKCGIECEVVSSTAMNHAWNYVKIGSDWYHVDVTMDDPMALDTSGTKSDMMGKVTHNYLLISDAAIKKAAYPHKSWDAGELPAATSTTYDKFFWRDSEAQICYIGGKWYYLDFNEASPGCNYKTTKSTEIQTYLKSYTFSTKKISTVYTLKSTWLVWGNSKSWYPASYARLASYKGVLYFNSYNSIRSYKPGDSSIKTFFSPSVKKGYVYGIKIVDGAVQYSIKTSPTLCDSTIYKKTI